MKVLCILFALAAAVTGLWAALQWFRASRVPIDLGYHLPGMPGGTVRRMGMEFPRTPEPANIELQQENQIMATWEAINEASRLNKQAAFWTAISIALSALSALAGVP